MIVVFSHVVYFLFPATHTSRMAIKIEMPKLSDTMTEGTVVAWHKNTGDEVEVGDVLAEIETDKATMEMEAFDDGVMGQILVQAGEKAEIGAALAILAEEGEDPESASADSSGSGAASADANAGSAPVETSGSADEAPEAAAAVPSAGAVTEPASGGDRVKASPLARKIAEDKGVDLNSISGSGPGGRIVKKDVESAQGGGSASSKASQGSTPSSRAAAPQQTSSEPASKPAPAPKALSAVASGEDKIVELSSMRRIIADRLLTSKQTIPHFYLHVEADVAPMMDLRRQVNSQAEQTHGNKYTVNDFILKAVINAAVAVPEVNASFNGDSIIQFANVGISVAVAVDDGLVTPVVKAAETKSMLQISREVKDMAGRARDKKLRPDEFDGGTITVSNLGAYGIESFDAIVNPPQAAILSVGGIIEKPVVKDGAIVPGLRMNLGLSCDHRVVDGAVGARFLGEIKKLIENPALMLI